MRTTSILPLVLLAPFGVNAQRRTTSKDATCGGKKGYTCLGSVWGSCCSQYGWCGATKDYCSPKKGCNSTFGECDGDDSGIVSSSIIVRPSASTRKSSASPTASGQPMSTNARCGPEFGGRTCQGSKWGNCCSQYSYCGSTNDYCEATTCQKGFGYCNPSKSSSKISSTLATSLSSSKASSSSTVLQSRSSAPVQSSSLSSSVSSTKASSSAPASSSQVSFSSSITIISSSSLASSTPAVSSSMISSAIMSSSSTSSASSAGPTCFSVPGCETFSGSVTQCTGESNGKCIDGFQRRCGSTPQQGSVTISKDAVRSTDGEACVSSCRALRDCIAFGFAPDSMGQYYCTLYSSVTSISTGFYNTYVKVCADPAASSSASLLASSNVIPSSSVISSSSVAPSSSSIIPSLSTTPSPISLEVSLTAVSSTTPSASALATCYRYPNGQTCPPVQQSFDTVCPTVPEGCNNGFYFRCNGRVDSGTLKYREFDTTKDACVQRCRADADCVGAVYAGLSSYCYIYSDIQQEGTISSPPVTLFRRLCAP